MGMRIGARMRMRRSWDDRIDCLAGRSGGFEVERTSAGRATTGVMAAAARMNTVENLIGML